MEVWSGYTVSESSNNSEPEEIAMAGVPIIKHARVKAWEPSRLERLLPAIHKISGGELPNSFLLFLIQKQSQALGKKDCSLSTLTFKTT